MVIKLGELVAAQGSLSKLVELSKAGSLDPVLSLKVARLIKAAVPEIEEFGKIEAQIKEKYTEKTDDPNQLKIVDPEKFQKYFNKLRDTEIKLNAELFQKEDFQELKTVLTFEDFLRLDVFIEGSVNPTKPNISADTFFEENEAEE